TAALWIRSPDRGPLVQAGGRVGAPGSADRDGPGVLSDVARAPARGAGGGAAPRRDRRRRAATALASSLGGPGAVSPVRTAPEQESALHPADPARGRRPGGHGFRPLEGAGCTHPWGSRRGARVRAPGERDRVVDAIGMDLARPRRSARSGVA